MGSVFVVVGPVRGEDLVGLAAEQEKFVLREDFLRDFPAEAKEELSS